MNPRERFLTALRGEIPDEVPISLSIGPSNAHKWVGDTDWRAIFQAHRLAGSIPTYGNRQTLRFFPQWRKNWKDEVWTNTAAERHGGIIKSRKITTPHGILTSRERIDRGEYFRGQTLEPLIKSRDDYEIYMTYIEEWVNSVDPRIPDEVRMMEAEVNIEGVWVPWITHTFYQFFWVLRPVDDYLLDFYDTPELMRNVLEVVRKVNELKLQVFNQSRSPAVITNLSGASSSIISPAFFKKWVLPELKWMTSFVSNDKLVGFHLTGKIREIFPMLMEAEPDFILRFESSRFGGDYSLKEAKGDFGDCICLMGGCDPHFLVQGSREEIRQEVLRCLSEAKEGGGYILANSDVIPAEADIENVIDMVQTAKRYGEYQQQ